MADTGRCDIVACHPITKITGSAGDRPGGRVRKVLNLWFEGIFAVMVAGTGVLLGYWFSRLQKPYWMFGYFIPLMLVLIYGVAIHLPALSFTPPISWMMIGRRKFAILGFIAAMMLTTPLSRLPLKRDRIADLCFDDGHCLYDVRLAVSCAGV